MRTSGTKQTRLAALHLLTLLTHHTHCTPATLAPSLPVMLPMVAAVATAGKLAEPRDEIGFARYVALRKLLLLLAANVLVLARQLAEAAAERRGGEPPAESWVELRQRQLQKKMDKAQSRVVEYGETIGGPGVLRELLRQAKRGTDRQARVPWERWQLMKFASERDWQKFLAEERAARREGLKEGDKVVCASGTPPGLEGTDGWWDRVANDLKEEGEREVDERKRKFERQQKEIEQQQALVGVALRLLVTSCLSLQMMLCVMSYRTRNYEEHIRLAQTDIARTNTGLRKRSCPRRVSAAVLSDLAGDVVNTAKAASFWLRRQVDEVGMLAIATAMTALASEDEAQADTEHYQGPLSSALFTLLNAARGPLYGVDSSVGACIGAAAGAFVEAVKAVPKLPQVLLEGAWALEEGEDTSNPRVAAPFNSGGGVEGGRASLGCSSNSRGGGSRGSKQEPAAAAAAAVGPQEAFEKVAVVSAICGEGCKLFPSGIYCNYLMCPWLVGPSELGILAGRRRGVGGMCGVCKTAVYCSRDCQMQDWEAGHGSSCRRRGGSGLDEILEGSK